MRKARGPASSSYYSGSSGRREPAWGLLRSAFLRAGGWRAGDALTSCMPTHSSGFQARGNKSRDETAKKGSKEERETPLLFRQLQDNETFKSYYRTCESLWTCGAAPGRAWVSRNQPSQALGPLGWARSRWGPGPSLCTCTGDTEAKPGGCHPPTLDSSLHGYFH